MKQSRIPNTRCKMTLDGKDRIEIMKAVRVAFKQIYGTQKDYERMRVVITAAELVEKFPSFTKEWINRYGYLLPRVRVDKWEDETCTDKWGYYWNDIQKDISEGRFRNLKPFIRTL